MCPAPGAPTPIVIYSIHELIAQLLENLLIIYPWKQLQHVVLEQIKDPKLQIHLKISVHPVVDDADAYSDAGDFAFADSEGQPFEWESAVGVHLL